MEYINSLLSDKGVLQFVVFTDDSIEVQYKDHTSLQISPCGANYQFTKSIEGCPGISDHHNVIRQRCRFATSQTKQKVELGLQLRNLFATRPYIPAQFTHLSDAGKVHLHRDVTTFYWVDDDGCSRVEEAGDGSVEISSQKDAAVLALQNNSFQCSARYLAKISPCTSRTPTPQQSPRDKENSGGKHHGSRRDYVWLRHVFPLQFCPPTWQYPLCKALRAQNKEVPANLESTLDCSHAPRPLPSTCAKQFRHTWHANQNSHNPNDGDMVLPSENSQMACNRFLKILWSNNTMFWVNCLKHVGDLGVEVWLPDGSILQSISATKFYFRHLVFCKSTGKVELERTYSPTALPMKADLKTVILRGVRLLSYIEQNECIALSNNTSTCWHDALSLETGFNSSTGSSSKTVQPTVDVVVPNLGKFSAINGSVQVSFDDGCTVHVAMSDSQYKQLQASTDILTEIPWRLRMPDGTYSMGIDLLHCDTSIYSYIKPSCDWVTWLARSAEERISKPFYSDSIYATDKLSMVSRELEKINLFNSLEESHSFQSNFHESDGSSFLDLKCSSQANSFTDDKAPICKRTDSDVMMPADIARALSNTSRAISDIDNILNACR